jgi:hypothetical protein
MPAIIEIAETRWRGHGLPKAKFGPHEKFGNDPAKHRDFSAVTHGAKDKGIPPFLILYVAGHPDTTAQAPRLVNVLKDAGLSAIDFGAKETTHTKINADLSKPDDPATKTLFEFLEKAVKKGFFAAGFMPVRKRTCVVRIKRSVDCGQGKERQWQLRH